MVKKSTNKELIKIFKDGVKAAAESQGIEPNELKRDEYLHYCIDNHLPRLNKTQLNELGGFKAAKQVYFPLTKRQIAAKKEIERQKEEAKIKTFILSTYVDMASTFGFTPSKADLELEGITTTMINKHFGSVTLLHMEAVKQNPGVFQEFINEVSYTKEDRKRLEKAVKNRKRFVITTAVSGKPIDPDFLASIENYLEFNNASLLILPCEDVASRNSTFRWELDPRLSEHHVVFDDLYLNKKFLLSSIMVSAKQINPLTGLERLAQRKGSMVLASPKQFLKFVANSNKKLPKALMTTGAITLPDYSTDLYMSKRTSYLAEFDHVMGAIVVEIEDDRFFHFRTLECGDKGEFIDLGYQYNPDGTVEEVENSVGIFGDTHVGVHDLDVNDALIELVEYANITEVIFHDIFDCRFNNHHDTNKLITRARLAMDGKISMLDEGRAVSEFLDDWNSRVEKSTIIKSNHDEALDKYIQEGRWFKDPLNFYHACDLARRAVEGKDLLKYLVEDLCELKSTNQVNWLERDEDYKVYEAELSAHGDLGANGSRGSLNSIEKAYVKAIVGHSHTAGILRGVKQVGTSSLLKLGYNRGPSSWTQTAAVEYYNGTSQLINFMKKDGKVIWMLEDE